MKKNFKINLNILAILIVFSSLSHAAELILPIPKPTIDKEIKKSIAKSKEIYPQKKTLRKRRFKSK